MTFKIFVSNPLDNCVALMHKTQRNKKYITYVSFSTIYIYIYIYIYILNVSFFGSVMQLH